jgi:nicotinate-nucleotide adenylyltransferase
MTIRLPRWSPGQRIGLMGGSFNPAHEGHLLASRLALRRLKLDRLWWLVTPGNPLKPIDGLPPLAERMLAAQAIARDPRIALTGCEAEIGAHYTYDSIVWLLRRAPTVRFVWIMGADNLLQFHLWRRWREMAQLLPIAVVDRPGSTLRALNSQAGAALAPFQVPEREAAGFARRRPPAIIFLHGPRSSLSSSAIRRVSGDSHSEGEPD